MGVKPQWAVPTGVWEMLGDPSRDGGEAPRSPPASM